jgi:hypothetical protein
MNFCIIVITTYKLFTIVTYYFLLIIFHEIKGNFFRIQLEGNFGMN